MSHHPVTEHFRIPISHEAIETQCDSYGDLRFLNRRLKNSMAEPILTTKTEGHQEKLSRFPGPHLHFLVSWCLGGNFSAFLSVLSALSAIFNNLLTPGSRFVGLNVTAISLGTEVNRDRREQRQHDA